MKRIDTSTKDVDEHGSGKHGFTNGTPGVTPATQLDESWFDNVQEEIANTVEATGQVLDGTVLTQLLRSIRYMIRKAAYADWTTDDLPGSHGTAINGIACRAQDDDIDEKWVAVGIGSAASRIYNSNSGESWTSQTPSGNEDLDVTWAGGGIDLFVAVGTGGDIGTSPDGATWTSRTSGTSDDLNAVYWNGTELFACGGTTGTVLKSSDGINWSDISTGAVGTLFDIAANSDGQIIVAVGEVGVINVSTNGGTSWASVGTDNVDWLGVAFDGTRWVVVGDGTNTMSTTDPEQWPANATSLGGTDLKAVVWDGEAAFLAVGNQIYTSASGEETTWDQRSEGVDGSLTRRCVAVGWGRAITGISGDTYNRSRRTDA